MERKDELYIAGAWVRAAGQERIEIINPSTEEAAFSVPEATEAEIDTAVGQARAVLDSGEWSSRPIVDRVAAVSRFAEALGARAGLNETLAAEMGTPISRATEVQGTVGMVQFYCAVAGQVPFEEQRSGAFRPSLVQRAPVGVVAAVVPWNAPIYLAVGKVVPALLAGCPVVLKPAPETAFSAYAIAEAADAAGFPPGLFSLVPAGRERSEYLISHPGVDKSSFTGSTATGQKIASIAIQQFKRFSLELGGKSAGIIMPDADLAAALPAILNGTMTWNAGQVCALLSRVLVPRALVGDFLDAYLPEAGKIVVGDALDPKTEMGPLVAKRQQTRVLNYIEAGKQEGARIVLGGGRPAGLDKGWFIEPTVFIDVDSSMRIAREEIFGPVISVLTYDTVDEAVALANDSTYGLSGAVFGSDKDAAIAVASRLRAGTVTVNTSLDFDFNMPFGGFKCSGMGREYGGVDGILNYTEVRAIGV